MNETNLNFLSPCIINSHFKTSEIYFVKSLSFIKSVFAFCEISRFGRLIITEVWLHCFESLSKARQQAQYYNIWKLGCKANPTSTGWISEKEKDFFDQFFFAFLIFCQEV